MNAILISPRVESITSRLERRIAGGTRLESIARLVDLHPATLEQLLKRQPINDQSMAWDDEENALDKLDEWLTFEYDQRAEDVLTRIERRLASGLTRERLANEAGIMVETLEYLLKRLAGSDRHANPWERDEERPAAAITKLEVWLVEEEAQVGALSSSRANTPTFQTVQKYLSLAHAGKMLLAITGDVGIGKSEAARAYASAHPKTDRMPGTIYVEFDELDNKPLAALQRILKAMPVRAIEAPRQENLLLDYLAAQLKPGDLIILDECNHLTGRRGSESTALGFIRNLHERGRAGIAMMGNPDFRARVWNSEKQEFSALVSRTSHFDLAYTSEDDVDAWMQWAGLTGKDLRKTLVRMAERPGQHGGLRTIARLVETHHVIFPGQPIEVASLQILAQAMGRQ